MRRILAVLVLLSGCPDDKWELVAHCSTGQAQHVNDKLRCYAHNGAPLLGKAWPWMESYQDPEVACDLCEGTEQPNDGGTTR